MTRAMFAMLAAETKKLAQAGLYKPERVRASGNIIDFTNQDYLGLAGDERLRAAAQAALANIGLGAGSARSFTGTLAIHHQLEQTLARFLGLPDAVVFGSGYLANLGLYEALFDSRDYLFCDALVHPSTAAGVRLSSATAYPYRNNDAVDLEDKLKRSRAARFRAVVTDGVYAFDGAIAALPGICELAERYEALVIVDDSLGLGVLGDTGRGSRELCGVMNRVDVVTGTFSKSLGGAGGGFVAGRKEIVDWLRQKSAPYLFSVGLAPPLAASALAAVELIERRETSLTALRLRVEELRLGLEGLGHRVLGGQHPALAVFVGGVVPLQKLVNGLYERGILTNGLCYPVVPEGEARLRLDVSARHSDEDIARTLRAFGEIGRPTG